MTTNNMIDVGLSGTTGTGNFVGATSPTLITPTLGIATATSLTFSPTTNGIVGTTTNDNAASGYVGQFITANVASGSGVNVPNTTATNITSISLTAGDWLVWGNVGLIASAGTTSTVQVSWVNTTSASIPTDAAGGKNQQEYSAPAGSSTYLPTGLIRVSINTTTTVFLSCFAAIAVSTMSAHGVINAFRFR